MHSTTPIEDIYTTVVRDVKELAETIASEKRRAWVDQQHKGSLNAYGINTPAIRKLINQYNPVFTLLSITEKCELAKMFYTSNWFEQATIGDALVEYAVKAMTPSHFDLLDDIADYFNNWASVDWLCLHGLQSLLLQYPEETLPLLRRWNCSDSVLKKRASVVAFVWKIGASGAFTDTILQLCDNLIWDKEDIVKKGVGWALRDALQGDRKKVCEYIKSLRRKGVSSVITLYALKDVKGRQRKDILTIKPSRTP